MRRISGLILVLCLCFVTSYVFADGSEIPYGTRGIAMGKAFTAVADDVSAIYWNPAGLTQLKGQGLQIDYLNIKAPCSFKGNNFITGDDTFNAAANASHIPDFAYYFGFEKMTVAIGAYAIAGLMTDFTQTALKSSGGVGIYNVGPSVGYEVNKELSVGASLNAVMGQSAAQGTLDMTGLAALGIIPGPLGAYAAILGSQDYSFTAKGTNWNANIGSLYKLGADAKIGVSYRLPQRIILEGTSNFLDKDRDFSTNLDIPGKFNLGVAYGWPQLKGLTSSLEMSITQWNKAWLDSNIDFQNLDLTADLNDILTNALFSGRTELNGRNNFSLSLGNEYRINEQWTARLGLLSEGPAIIPAEKTTPLYFLPKFKAVTLGAGYTMGRVGLNLGYALMLGSDVVRNTETIHPFLGVNIDPYTGTYKENVNVLMLNVSVKI